MGVTVKLKLMNVQSNLARIKVIAEIWLEIILAFVLMAILGGTANGPLMSAVQNLVLTTELAMTR